MDESTLHDLRTTLTVISGQTQLMQHRIRRGDAPDRDQMLASLDAITTMVAKLNAAIDAFVSETQKHVPPSA